MSTSLQTIEKPKALAPDVNEFGVMKETASMLVKTGFLPQSIKTPEQAMAIILTGRELGIGMMAALNTINVIQGKPTVSPQLMLALIERSGQLDNIAITGTDTSVTCTMKRRGRTAHAETFGEKEATAMGFAAKENYKKQAATMYRWRAVAACARVAFPDVILGLYSPDEMGAVTNEDGEFVAPASMNVVPMQSQQPDHVDAEVMPSDDPEQRREQYIESIRNLCTDLNNEGDSIKWNKKTLTEYINALFNVTNGLDSMSFDTFDVLIEDLDQRYKDIIASRETAHV